MSRGIHQHVNITKGIIDLQGTHMSKAIQVRKHPFQSWYVCAYTIHHYLLIFVQKWRKEMYAYYLCKSCLNKLIKVVFL